MEKKRQDKKVLEKFLKLSNKKKSFIKLKLFVKIIYLKYLILIWALYMFAIIVHVDWDNYTKNVMRNKVVTITEMQKYGAIEKFSFEDKIKLNLMSKLNAVLKNGKKLTIEVYSDNYGMLLKKIVKIDGKIVSQKKYPPASKWEQLKMRWRSITILP